MKEAEEDFCYCPKLRQLHTTGKNLQDYFCTARIGDMLGGKKRKKRDNEWSKAANM